MTARLLTHVAALCQAFKQNFMPCRLDLNRTLRWTLFLSLLVGPAAAHNIEISGDVAGTWHVEPNHAPKAGEAARAWVVLTRKGGQILPLEQTNCQMAVYLQPRRRGDSPVLQPAVKAINAEKYQGIPGADIVFPKTGLYQLQLSCTPKSQGSFQPFQFKYDITVAAGAATLTPKAETSSALKESAQSQQSLARKTREQQLNQSNQFMPGWIFLTIATTSIIGLGILVRRYSTNR